MVRKNVILITIDCLRPDHLNCYGYKLPTSPFISSLAQSGWIFNNAYANSSYTSASIASMLTSSFPFDYGEYLEYSTPAKLSRKRILLSEVLKAYEYSTAFFHDNPYLSPIFGYNRGFDLVVDFGGRSNVSTKIKSQVMPIFKNQKIQRFIWRTKKLVSFLRWYFMETPLLADSEVVLKEAFRWVKRLKSPYFLWTHLMDTHIPYCPRHRFLDKFRLSKYNALSVTYKRFRRKQLSNRELEIFRLLYDTGIYQVDYFLSQYLPKITKGNMENSYVIITADHGEELESKKKAGSHSGILQHKLLHVPLIIAGGDIKPRIIEQKSSLINLAPTILDLLEIEKPKSYKGNNLLRKRQPENVIAQGIFKGKKYQRIL